MGLIKYDQVPRNRCNLIGLACGKFIGCDHDPSCNFKRLTAHGLLAFTVALGFQDFARDREFRLKLLRPLLPKRSRNDQKNAPLLLCPSLSDDEPGFYGFPEPNFVSEDRTFREGRLQREESGIDL